MEPCYVCHQEMNREQLCYGHSLNDHYYRPVNLAAEGQNAMIHRLHLRCLMQSIATSCFGHSCAVFGCRIRCDIPEDSPLCDVYRSAEIQSNARLRHRWMQNFPGLERVEATLGTREKVCRRFSYFLGRTVDMVLGLNILVAVSAVHAVYAVAYAISLYIAAYALMISTEIIKQCITKRRFQHVDGSILIFTTVTAVATLVICYKLMTVSPITHRTIDKFLCCAEACGDFVEKKVFVLTNNATRRIANMRIFQRAA